MAKSEDRKQQLALFEEEGGDDDVELKVNEEYARRFQHNKEREELHRLKEKHPEIAARLEVGARALPDTDKSETESVEEDDGFIPERTEAEIFETLKKIRQRDPSIYDKNAKFYTELPSEGEEAPAKKKEEKENEKRRPKYLKDVIAEQALKEARGDGSEEEDAAPESVRAKTYDAEQRELRKAFLEAANDGGEEEEDEEFGGMKRRDGGGRVEVGEEEEAELRARMGMEARGGEGEVEAALQGYFGSREELTDDDRFLRDYVMGRKWMREEEDEEGGEGGEGGWEDVDVEEDEEFLEEQEEMEYKYNFRFEEPGGDRLVTHPREVETMRRGASTRAEKRKAREERKREEKEARAQEVRRLKNLKKKEIESYLEDVHGVAGKDAPVDVLAKLVEGDFDPEEYDKHMQQAFGDDYYNAQDDMEGFWDDKGLMKELEQYGSDGEAHGFEAVRRKGESGGAGMGEKGEEEGGEGTSGADDEPGSEEEDEEKATEMAAEQREKMRNMLEEYYKLDYEDVVGGDIKTRFRYREVEPMTYGLSAEEVLKMDDRDLNQIVGLKKLAPYREDKGHIPERILRYKLEAVGVKGKERDGQAGRGWGRGGERGGRGGRGGSGGRGGRGESGGRGGRGSGRGGGQGPEDRKATYSKPLLVKRGERLEDAQKRVDRKRKREEGQKRNEKAQEGQELTRAQKKNLKRAMKRAEKRQKQGGKETT